MKRWFKLYVEDKHGIQAIHYRLAVFASSAREDEEREGCQVFDVVQVSR